jgi:hypothetical protein
MDILIACHCKAKHSEVIITKSITEKSKTYSLYDDKQIPLIKKEFGINRIDYIDIRCNKDKNNNQYTNWDDLPKYDAIFLIHCPVYGMFFDKEEYEYINSIRKMYKDMEKHLKPNGYVYIEKNILPDTHKVCTGSNCDKSSRHIKQSIVKQANNKKHIRKVYNDIFNGDDKYQVNYKLDILEKDKLNRIQFHIFLKNDTKLYQNKVNMRVMILKFPKKHNNKHTLTKKHKHKSKHNKKTSARMTKKKNTNI